MELANAIATALSLGARAAKSGRAQNLLSKPYTLLKSVLESHLHINLSSLEQVADSADAVHSIAIAINKQHDIDKSAYSVVLAVARNFLEAAKYIPHADLSVSIDELEAASTAIMQAAANETGVTIKNISVSGNIIIGEISTGKNVSLGIEPVEPWPEPGKTNR